MCAFHVLQAEPVQPVYYKIIPVELELLQNLTKLPYSIWNWRQHYSYDKRLKFFGGHGNYVCLP